MAQRGCQIEFTISLEGTVFQKVPGKDLDFKKTSIFMQLEEYECIVYRQYRDKA